jgi:hypothetical protein
VALAPQTRPVPANGRATVALDDLLSGYLAAGHPVPLNVSTRVDADVPLVVERPLYFRFAGYDGATDVIGSDGPAPVAMFAEGTLRPGFLEYLTVQNPNAAAAPVTFTFQASDDANAPVVVGPATRTVPAQSRGTFALADLIGLRASALNVSVRVDAAQPVVVERPLYFHADPGVGTVVDGATDVIGARGPGRAFLFAEGTVRPGFAEFVTLQNPDSYNSATATLSFQGADDGGSAVTLAPATVLLPPGSRRTVDVTAHLASAGGPAVVNLSLGVTATAPILAERPLYFSTPLAGGVDGGTDVIGLPSP